MRARSFALRDAFPDVLKGLITIEEAQDIPARGAPTAPPSRPDAPAPTIESTAEPATAAPPDTPEPAPAAATIADAITPEGTPPRLYPLTTRQGTTTFRTAGEWLDAWAKLVRGCKAARVLDKLQTARVMNQANIAAVAAFDPEPAATLTAELDRALAKTEPAHDPAPPANPPEPGGERDA